MTNSPRAQIIQVPNLLAAKVGGDEGEGLISTLIDDAESRLGNLAEDYLKWVTHELEMLEQMLQEPPDQAAPDLAARAHDILHNMKGNGTTFGYNLITSIASSGCSILQVQAAIDPDRRAVLRHHVAALRIVIDKKITGLGGDSGKRLMARLESLAAPFRRA